jgi:signal transduction histidine kinase
MLKNADNHSNSGKSDSLLNDARRAFEFARIAGDSGLLSRASAYICLAYEELKSPDSSRVYRALSMDINRKIGDHRGLAQDYFNKARLFLDDKQLDSCIYYARLCRDLSRKYHFLFVERSALGTLSVAYEGRNNDSALHYFKGFFEANDALYGIRKNQRLNAVELNQQKLEQALEAERKQARSRLIVGVVGAMLAMALLTGFFLYRNIQSKHRINLELNRSLEDLQSAQNQLVHAEKMASLGELTAGIAHEIQNPLNFVSNFAEVNAELTQELKLAADKGDLEEIRALVEDIHANEIKIREHGKRADSIVKSMLQHSRSSTGQQEPVDVNALCDEYVKLAYHGMRAKEKNFNANLKTYLTNGLPEVPMVRQDIGRVLLNIVNNAFHAVTERSMTAREGYQPTVTIKTFMPSDSKIVAGKAVRMVSISIADNGTGIPDALRKKIFQPFFTTKPTGQGTGLGLSLSYDIVKAHGGEITVDSEPGQGTTFLIQLHIA